MAPPFISSLLEQLPGPERRDAYDAISHKHESIYWHTGGCPHCELKIGYGLSVSDEGEMSVTRKDLKLRQHHYTGDSAPK